MFGIVTAFVAGFLAPSVEESLARPVAKALAPRIVVAPEEIRLLGFMLMLLLAALIAAVFDSGSALGISLAAVLGYFAPRIAAAVRTALDGRRR